jgi:hypothetical protein
MAIPVGLLLGKHINDTLMQSELQVCKVAALPVNSFYSYVMKTPTMPPQCIVPHSLYIKWGPVFLYIQNTLSVVYNAY